LTEALQVISSRAFLVIKIISYGLLGVCTCYALAMGVVAVAYEWWVFDMSEETLALFVTLVSLYLTVCLCWALHTVEEKAGVLAYLIFSVIVLALAVSITVLQFMSTFISSDWFLAMTGLAAVREFFIVVAVCLYAVLLIRQLSGFVSRNVQKDYSELSEGGSNNKVPSQYCVDNY